MLKVSSDALVRARVCAALPLHDVFGGRIMTGARLSSVCLLHVTWPCAAINVLMGTTSQLCSRAMGCSQAVGPGLHGGSQC